MMVFATPSIPNTWNPLPQDTGDNTDMEAEGANG